MPARLRSIAVFVTERGTGAFQWELAELSADHTWCHLQTADTPRATYREAMADGLLALQELVTDLDAGPRAESALKHGRRAPERGTKRMREEVQEDHEDQVQNSSADPKRTSVFGFGGVR